MERPLPPGTAVPAARSPDGDRGATMPEYGLMLALIAAVCVSVIGAIGADLSDLFQRVAALVGG